MTQHTYKPFFIGLGILLTGVVGLIILVALKPDPPKESPVVRAPLVESIPVLGHSGSLDVSGTGIVAPSREVNLAAEVAGRIIHVHKSFVTGGHFDRGDTLLTIDPSDYLNAVAVAEAEVTQRHLELLLAEEESSIARDEWERLRTREGQLPDPPQTELGSLVLKEPQMKLARAVLEGAEARLSDARARLGRTVITAPFDGNIRARMAEEGQFVGPGSVVASFYGTEHVEVVVALRTEKMALLGATGGGLTDHRVPATVSGQIGNRRPVYEGYLSRIEGAVDPTTRTYRVVVRVDNPYNAGVSRPALFVGTFVDVSIRGESLESYYEFPREVLRDNDTVWIVSDGKIRISPVKVLQIVEDQVFVTTGVTESDRLVSTPLPVVSDGMAVRVR